MRMAIIGFTFLFLICGTNAQAGLILNGDFEAGNTDFVSDYLFANGLGIGGQETFDLITNPSLHHPSGANYGDHTTGTGTMMAVNESLTPNVLIWSELISISPETTFNFTGWISSWTPSNPSVLDVRFNGSSIGTITAPSTTGIWSQFEFSWDSGTSTSALIELRNLTTADIGGDFSLDDLNLEGPQIAAVPEPSSIVIFLIGGALAGGYQLRRWNVCRDPASAIRGIE